MRDVHRSDQLPEHVFAQRVRQLREAAKLSQAQLAAKLTAEGTKFDPSAITRLEKGTRMIRLNEAVAIADTFGVKLEEMLLPGRSLIDQIHHLEALIQQQEGVMRLAETTLPVNRRLLARLREQLAESSD